MKRGWCYVNSITHVFECRRCGGTRPDGLPCDLKAWCAMAKAFEIEHRACKPSPSSDGSDRLEGR